MPPTTDCNPVHSAVSKPSADAANRLQFTCLLILSVILASMVATFRLYPMVAHGVSGDEPGPKPTDLSGRIEERIDPNAAGWAELARLPRIGEATAKRIVAYREARRADRGTETPCSAVFTCPEDLSAVAGIGPKTLIRIADYLKFPTEEP